MLQRGRFDLVGGLALIPRLVARERDREHDAEQERYVLSERG
jgi:hypothetical protein